MSALQAGEKLIGASVLKGHDFSRAEKTKAIDAGFAGCGKTHWSIGFERARLQSCRKGPINRRGL
jgi:hypothetical protein